MALVLNFIISYLEHQTDLGRPRRHDTRSSARSFMGSLAIYVTGTEISLPLLAGLPGRELYAQEVVQYFSERTPSRRTEESMKRIRLAAILAVGVALVSTGIWWFISSASREVSTDILTSGFVEARDVAIAFEAGGRIVEIAAREGDSVRAGATLVKLDDSLLKAQKQQAEANVKLAQALLEQAVASRNGAKKAWENALDVQRNPLELEAKITAAQGEVEMAELSLELRWVFEFQLGRYGAHLNERIAALQRDLAQARLDALLAIKDNPQTIKAAVDQADFAYQIAAAAVKAAEGQVEQAGASLEVIDIQISKLSTSSPISGVVSAQHAEVGEIAKAGAPILTITELDEVTLTGYVPESKIGLVRLGQKVIVSVDSYPGASFSGAVVHIAPQALFTPRNVQLKEEREKTVFAVKITLANPDQKLKPGMPADARIITGSGE
jgi:HlyD family secretion protein